MTLVKVNNPINKSFDGLMNELFNDHKKSMEKGSAMEVSEMVHRWLIQQGIEVLN